jgi:hypothetical protein
VKRARFVAPAREEFLAEIAYYNQVQPGQGARFAAAVEEATARALRSRSQVRHRTKTSAASFSRNFHSPLPIGQTLD